MSFLLRFLGLSAPDAAHALPFEEDLLSAPISGGGHGYFVTKPNDLLKSGRYRILRKLGRGPMSSTFLVEDTQPIAPDHKYYAAKILSVKATVALEHGLLEELNVLQAIVDKSNTLPIEVLPILRDHFAQRGPHGVHYCFVMNVFGTDVHAFRASSPNGRLPIFVIKPIIAQVATAVAALHSLGIIHADIRADNVLFEGPGDELVEDSLAKDPPLIRGSFELNGEMYPILGSQSFDYFDEPVTPHLAELASVVLSGFGSTLWVDKSQPEGDIGAFALRAPENLIRAECGEEIDIWAVGCLTYELITGEKLFGESVAGISPDEALLLEQYALTGEVLDPELVASARARTVQRNLDLNASFDNNGVYLKAASNPFAGQTLAYRLEEHNRLRNDSDKLTPIQIKAATRFLTECLRLNPKDRISSKKMEVHLWLLNAFMGTEEELEESSCPHRAAEPNSSVLG